MLESRGEMLTDEGKLLMTMIARHAEALAESGLEVSAIFDERVETGATEIDIRIRIEPCQRSSKRA